MIFAQDSSLKSHNGNTRTCIFTVCYLKQLARIGLCFLLYGFINQVAATENILPEIGDASYQLLTPEIERRLGRRFMRQIRQQMTLIDDPQIHSYLQSIGQKLVAASENTIQQFTFFIIDDPNINAVAAPGGYIGINSGVLLSARTEAELAGVIAHEIAHITQHHLARMIEKNKRLSVPMAMATLLGTILASLHSADAAQAAIIAGQSISTQQILNFTRTHEQEADRIGMQLLVRAGFDPNGLPDFFEHLEQSSKFQQQGPEFLRTHPLTASRLAESKERARQYGLSVFPDLPHFALIKNKLRVHHTASPTESILYFRAAMKQEPNATNRYGLVLALMAGKHYQKALAELNPLLEQDRDNISYLLVKAKLLIQTKSYRQGLQIYQDAYALYTDYRPLVLAYSRALLTADKPKKARALLRRYAQIHMHDLETYELLGQAEGMLGNEIEVALLHAKFYHSAGYTRLALDKFCFIQRHYELDFQQNQQISASMAELEHELALDEELGF